MELLVKLEHVLKHFLPKVKVHIAYSGGVDSHVLLHAITQLRLIYKDLSVSAIHIHHGLLEEADSWAEHCQQICQLLEVPFQVKKVSVPVIKGESLEAMARSVRYHALSEVVEEGDLLLLAHHQDDQAETCLLQFLRGAGLKGLSAMPEIVPFVEGYLCRPFLTVSQNEILQYAKEHSLSWIEDSSNHDLRFARNFLRYQIIPELKNKWPSLGKTIARVSSHCAEAAELLKEIAIGDLDDVKGKLSSTLLINELKQLPVSRQKNVIREWIQINGFPLPSSVKLNQMIEEVIYSKDDSQSRVIWQNMEARKYKNLLFVFSQLTPHDSKTILTWDLSIPLILPANLGFLTSEIVKGKGLNQELIKNKTINVKFRQGGEVCSLPKRAGTHTLKKLFQEWEIPMWLRDRIPLIYVENQLAMVIGYAVCEPFSVNKNEYGMDIQINKKGINLMPF